MHNEQAILDSPSVSFWLKDALRDSRRRDIVDAYYDAKLLTEILEQRVNSALGKLNCPKK